MESNDIKRPGKEIGIWLISNGLVSWPKGKPPKLSLDNISENIMKGEIRDLKSNLW